MGDPGLLPLVGHVGHYRPRAIVDRSDRVFQVDVAEAEKTRDQVIELGKKVKFSHTRYRALGPELIPVYRQSARR